jgi:hypothetical protein
MAKCFICNKELTNPDNAKRGYGDDCAKTYKKYLAACGVSEAELTELEALDNETVNRRLHCFKQALGQQNIRGIKQTLSAVRRGAAHLEAIALDLKDAEYFDYINRRADGETAAELRAEIEESNKLIEIERRRYLADDTEKIVFALMEQVEQMEASAKPALYRQSVPGYGTPETQQRDQQTIDRTTGWEEALLTALSVTELPIADLVELAMEFSYRRVATLIQTRAAQIEQQRRFRQGIERRLLADAPTELKLAA